MKFTPLWCILALCTLVAVSKAQGTEEKDVFVYMLGFANVSMDRPDMKGFQEILISSWEDATGRIQIPFIGLDEFFSLNSANNRVYTRTISTDLVTQKGEGPRNKAIRITGTRQLNIQAVKSKTATTDGFLALPITEDAKEFYTISASGSVTGHSVFVIAALFPHTCLEAYAVNGNSYRKIQSLTQMKEFDIFQFESETDDVTGVFINATRPIAVFSGHECLEEPANTRFCDHAIIQVPPVADWGTQFAIAPILGRLPEAGYSVRVLAANANTEVTISSTGQRRVLSRGNYIHGNVTDSQTGTVVTCSKPCLVSQYGRSWKYVDDDIESDAFMTLIPPLERYVANVTFSTAKFYDAEFRRSFDFRENYVGIMAPNAMIGRVTLDKQVVSGNWEYLGLGLSMISLPVDAGYHSVGVNGVGGQPIMGYAYGHALLLPSSYGYPLGYQLNGEHVRGPWNYYFGAIPDVLLRDCTVNTGGVRGPDLIHYLHVDLRTAVASDCAAAVIVRLSARFDQLKDYVNRLFCNKVLCADLTGTAIDSLSLNWIRRETSVIGVDIDVIMTTSIDDSAGAMYKCRKPVLDAIFNDSWWRLPEAVPGCPDIDFSAISPRMFLNQDGSYGAEKWSGGSDGGSWNADAGVGVFGGQAKWRQCTNAFSDGPGVARG